VIESAGIGDSQRSGQGLDTSFLYGNLVAFIAREMVVVKCVDLTPLFPYKSLYFLC
jgi:hypothetical protein